MERAGEGQKWSGARRAGHEARTIIQRAARHESPRLPAKWARDRTHAGLPGRAPHRQAGAGPEVRRG